MLECRLLHGANAPKPSDAAREMILPTHAKTSAGQALSSMPPVQAGCTGACKQINVGYGHPYLQPFCKLTASSRHWFHKLHGEHGLYKLAWSRRSAISTQCKLLVLELGSGLWSRMQDAGRLQPNSLLVNDQWLSASTRPTADQQLICNWRGRWSAFLVGNGSHKLA